MKQENEAEIRAALEGTSIEFEPLLSEEDSPLNEPVVDRSVQQNSTKQQGSDQTNEVEEETDEAGEQQINENGSFESEDDELEFELPPSYAKQAADAYLGIADNFLALGGGFFVKIKKHKEFYDFPEVIQVIDEQNEKNVQRIRLDEEDKALLRPLLIPLLQKQTKKLTPEQLFWGAAASVAVKWVKKMFEIRAENNQLVDRIRGIVREELSRQAPKKFETTQEESFPGEENVETDEAETIDVEEIEVVDSNPNKEGEDGKAA